MASGLDVTGLTRFVVGPTPALAALHPFELRNHLSPVVVLGDEAHRAKECLRIFLSTAAAAASAAVATLRPPYLRQCRGNLRHVEELCNGREINPTSKHEAGLALFVVKR